jgi:aspartokinase-like uncharacterized kinase
MPPAAAPTVVKVGGSLYDLPDLAARLRRWLARQRRVLLIPGGGALADAVRDLDRRHRLGDLAAHWIALHALSVAAHFLATLLSRSTVVTRIDSLDLHWEQKTLPILDPFSFAHADEASPRRLPCSWDVTSDAIAARAAVVTVARRLVLLKSTTPPAGLDWRALGEQGYVDRHFVEVLATAEGPIDVQVLNFRDGQA